MEGVPLVEPAGQSGAEISAELTTILVVWSLLTSALVGPSPDDLAHEQAPVNIPGTWQDKYPSWSRRMREPLETLLAEERTVSGLGNA